MANLFKEKPVVKVVMLKGQDGEEKLINQADGSGLSFWIGTQAEYDAIPEEELITNCVYYITDNTADNFNTRLNELDNKVDNNTTAIADNTSNIDDLTADFEKMGNVLWKHSGTPATLNGDDSYIELDGYFYGTKAGILIVCGVISSGVIQVQASTFVPKAIMAGYGIQMVSVHYSGGIYDAGPTRFFCSLNHDDTDEEHGTRIYGDVNNTSSTYGILAVIGY